LCCFQIAALYWYHRTNYIVILQLTASSTILSKQTDTILPGKSSKIEVKYNMAVGKTITVESNAVNYDEGRVPLKLKEM
jgi:hypothetical protein